MKPVPDPNQDQDRDALNADLSALLAEPGSTPGHSAANIAIPDNPEVRAILARITGPEVGRLQDALVRAGPYRALIENELARRNLPPGLIAVVLQESAFDPTAVSKSGAAGLWQFLPATARLMGLRFDAFVDQRFDPIASTGAALAYLEQLHDQFDDWLLALAAYNWGKGSVGRLLEEHPGADFWELSRAGVVRDETRDYVPGILARLAVWQDPGRYGLEGVPAMAMATIDLPPLADVPALERLAKSGPGSISRFNPHLLTDYVPSYESGCRVLVERATRDAIASLKQTHALSTVVASPDRLRGVRRTSHAVKKGETLWRIAQIYETSLSSLLAFNGWTTAPALTPGSRVVVYERSR